jgi:hypothetical protein
VSKFVKAWKRRTTARAKLPHSRHDVHRHQPHRSLEHQIKAEVQPDQRGAPWRYSVPLSVNEQKFVKLAECRLLLSASASRVSDRVQPLSGSRLVRRLSRRPPWQAGTTPFPAVTRRYKIVKSQPAALPERSTRFAEVVLLVVLCDVEHGERRARVLPS